MATRWTSNRPAQRWERYGQTPIASWVAGAAKPTAANTGPTTSLTTYTPAGGTWTITTPGTTIEGLDIFGRIVVQAANVTIRNCRVRGDIRADSTTNTGLIVATSASCVNLLVEDSLLVPDSPSVVWTGIIGHDYTARRVETYHAVDGLGVYNTASPLNYANVVIEGCYIHDLYFKKPDPNHSDWTHNDGIQIQGNGGISIVGNTIDASISQTVGTWGDSPYNPSATGQAIGITPNVSAVPNVLIDKNWLNYGAQSITIIPASKGTSTSATITNNRFGRGQPNLLKDGVYARRTILVDPTLTMPGLPASTGADTAGNVFDDDSTPVTVYRTTSY